MSHPYGTFNPDGAPAQTAAQRRLFKRGLGCAMCLVLLAVIGVSVFAYVRREDGDDAPFTHLHATQHLPADMLALIDEAVDPCDNFYEYACGGFERRAALQNDQLEFAYAWDGVSRNNTKRLDPLIAESKGLAGIFYRSCLNTSAIEASGTKPLRPFVKQVEDVKDLVSLEAVIYWMHKANVVTFFDWSVEVDPRDPRKSALYLMQGGITLPSPLYYTSPAADMQEKRDGYLSVAEHVLTNVCALMEKCDVGTWPKLAAQQALGVETEMAKLFASPEQQRIERAKPYSIEDVTKLSPSLHLQRFINAMAGTYHSHGDTIASKITIMIRNEEYFRRMSDFIGTVELAHLQAYLLFRLAFVLGADMNSAMEDAGFQLQKIVTGQMKKVPRWKKCMHAAMNALPDDVGKLFVDNFFDAHTKQAAQQMVLRLKMAFKRDVEGAVWMVNSTRQAALDKLHDMFFAVGEPAHLNEYHGVTLSETEFLWNGLQLSEWYIHHSFSRLTRPVDRRRWGSTSPTMVDAFYSYTDNGLFVPAGILQPPFFSAGYDDARNYGALGGVLGHEITHGFDDQGRKFDARGESADWWTAADVARFTRKADCIRDLYGGYEVLGRRVDGELTLGENIADMGGVKVALSALRALTAERGGRLTRRALELFFTAWGQNWCVVERRKAQELQLMTDEHAPNQARVNGPLANLPEFAHTFSCPKGSKMAPAHTCSLW